ncbi:MAG: outer membrane lipoprotein carrier protein LolA [Chitinispirillaceae bacterium]|nr:outer membrane lipoprotein carrier protein LolA [Chitinispirillaceae bacterium]
MSVRSRIILAGIAAACVATVPQAAAQDPGVGPLLNKVRSNYDLTRSLSTDYALTIYWSVREKEEKRKGSIILASNDRFHISAGDELFVSNGKTYWHYSPVAKQVVVKRLAETDMSVLPSQIFARFILSCTFRIEARDAGIAALVWENDSTTIPYTTIRVWVREKNGRIAKCVMIDRSDNRFTYTFSSTKLGRKIPGKAFEFDTPKNVRVLDMQK